VVVWCERRQYRSVAAAVASVTPDLVGSVKKAATHPEDDSFIKHVQTLTGHIQKALGLGTPPLPI
jgi:hypothetical protein